MSSFFFFFQAEDGIRDLTVTGVQTCALPIFSGPALAADHHRHTGRRLTGFEIADLAGRGDAGCSATLGRYADRLARGLAAVINLIDPDAIVLGGGVSGIAMLYRQVPVLWSRHIFSDHVVTRLLPPVHGDSSGVRGAASLWRPDEEW